MFRKSITRGKTGVLDGCVMRLYWVQELEAQAAAAQELETELLQAREAQVAEREAAAAQLAATQADLEAARQARADVAAQLDAAHLATQQLEEQRRAVQAAQNRVGELELAVQVVLLICVVPKNARRVVCGRLSFPCCNETHITPTKVTGSIKSPAVATISHMQTWHAHRQVLTDPLLDF